MENIFITRRRGATPNMSSVETAVFYISKVFDNDRMIG
jgi:hypothetical protein